MTFKRDTCMHTMTKKLTFKCILTLDKWSDFYIVFVMMKNKQKLYFSYYYKNKTHVQNDKIIPFRPFLKAQISQI